MHDIKTPAFLTLSHIDEEGYTTVITATYRRNADRYTASSVSVANPMDPVLGKTLRTTSLRMIMDQTLREALREPNEHLTELEPVRAFLSTRRGRAVAKKYREAPTQEHLEHAALVYRLARATGAFTIRAVQSSFGIEYADARRWVDRLKRRGLV